MRGIIETVLFFALMAFCVLVVLVGNAMSDEAKLPVTVRIVTAEQSCIENGTNCDKAKEDVARVLNEMEPAAEWTPAQDGDKPDADGVVNYE